jgi:hypothetical protein
VRIDPDNNRLQARLPLLLRPKDRSTISTDYTFPLRANGGTQPIDVFAVWDKYPGKFVLFFAADWTDPLIRGQDGDTYRFEFEIEGRNVQRLRPVATVGLREGDVIWNLE